MAANPRAPRLWSPSLQAEGLGHCDWWDCRLASVFPERCDREGVKSRRQRESRLLLLAESIRISYGCPRRVQRPYEQQSGICQCVEGPHLDAFRSDWWEASNQEGVRIGKGRRKRQRLRGHQATSYEPRLLWKPLLRNCLWIWPRYLASLQGWLQGSCALRWHHFYVWRTPWKLKERLQPLVLAPPSHRLQKQAQELQNPRQSLRVADGRRQACLLLERKRGRLHRQEPEVLMDHFEGRPRDWQSRKWLWSRNDLDENVHLWQRIVQQRLSFWWHPK